MDDECDAEHGFWRSSALCVLHLVPPSNYTHCDQSWGAGVSPWEGWDILEELKQEMAAGVNEVCWDPLTTNRSWGACRWACSYPGMEHAVPAVMLLLAMDSQGRFMLIQFIASSILKLACSRCKLIQPNPTAWILLGAQLHEHNNPLQPQICA